MYVGRCESCNFKLCGQWRPHWAGDICAESQRQPLWIFVGRTFQVEKKAKAKTWDNIPQAEENANAKAWDKQKHGLVQEEWDWRASADGMRRETGNEVREVMGAWYAGSCQPFYGFLSKKDGLFEDFKERNHMTFGRCVKNRLRRACVKQGNQLRGNCNNSDKS